MATIYPENIPAELKDSFRWSVWKLEIVEGKPTKVPYIVEGKRGKSNDPSGWCKFDTALTRFQEIKTFNGICWMLPITPEDIIFIDLDKCIKDGIIEPWAQDVIDRFDSYTEKSQSGKGLHILIKGRKPIKRCRKAGSVIPAEIYDSLRLCCLTGDVVDGHTTIELRQEALDWLFETNFPDELKRARNGTPKTPPGRSSLSDEAIIVNATMAKNGSNFKLLWDGSTLGYNGDDSAADMALMNMLAFWTGGDAVQMERLFSASARGQRDKCRNRPDYTERTIQKAIADAREFYTPPKSDYRDEMGQEQAHKNETETDAKDENVINEDEAAKYAIPSNPKLVLNLERDNFISQFIAYGGELSDAYPDYWFMGALELLAIINDQKTYVPLRTERVFPNVYINLLGSSTTSHKSTILKKVASIIDQIGNGRYHEAPENGSPEGWLEAMTETPHAYCNQDESSGFLNRMKKQDYMSGMTEMLNNCYDGTSFTKRNTKKRRGEPSGWRVANPYYNQMYATTPSKFSFATSAIDIHSGFWVRFLHAYPNYARDNFTPLGEASEELTSLDAAIITRLKKICDQMLDQNVTRANLEPAGWEVFRKWQIRWNRAIRNTNDDFLGQIVGRYTIYAIKLAQLFAMGRNDFTRHKMTIRTAHIQAACDLIDSYFVPHALAVRDLIGEGSAKDANLIIKIETVLRVHGGRLAHREMLRKIKVVHKQLDEALNTMVLSGSVTIRTVKNARGRPTQTIFLNGEDNVILSPNERQYENQTVKAESKKAKSDNMEEDSIHKTHTTDTLQDTVHPYCHNVTDENAKSTPLQDSKHVVYNRAGDSDNMKQNQEQETQNTQKEGGDNMGDNMDRTDNNTPKTPNKSAGDNMGDNMGDKPKDTPTMGPHPRRDEPTPAIKAQLWADIRAKLKKYSRKDGKRRGLAVADLQPAELELVRETGWTQETTETGISILWAPEKALAAMGLQAAG